MWPFGSKKNKAQPQQPDRTVSPAARHAQAQIVIERYKNEGWPFILYLRNFRYTVFQGDHNEGYLLWQYLQNEAPNGCGLFMIDDPNDLSADRFSVAYGRTTPTALAFRDEEWRDQFLWLMRHAAMIIDEYYVDSPGSTWELEQIAAAGLIEKTVVVTPSPGGVFKPVDALPHVKPFWRALFRGELENGNTLFGWERARDLFQRIENICHEPEGHRTKPDGNPAALPSLYPDLALHELFQACDHPYTIVTRLPADGRGAYATEHLAGIAEALHIAYAHLQRYVVGLTHTVQTLRGGRLAPDESHNLLMSELYSADMCLRARLGHTFPSDEAQLGAARGHLVTANQWLAHGAGAGDYPRAFWGDLMGKAAKPDELWWRARAV